MPASLDLGRYSMSHRHDRRSRKLRVERLEERVMLAGDWEFLKDTRPIRTDLAIGASYLTDVSGTLYFTSYSPIYGTELWKSDGSGAGTIRVKDINPGPDSSKAVSLTNVNGTLFFVASNGTPGPALWRSDGTEAGTTFVKRISSTASTSYFGAPINAIGGSAYFYAESTPGGALELWRTDGSESGTTRMRDLTQGVAEFSLSTPHELNGALYFTARDLSDNPVLLKSSGPSNQLTLVKVLGTAGATQYVSSLTSAGSVLYVSIASGSDRAVLWRSDGTEAGTFLLREFTQFSPNMLTANVASTLYFTAATPETGLELWKSNGTVVGTTLVRDIAPGQQNAYISDLSNYQGVLLFNANDRASHGTEVWRSDGSAEGTYQLKDIYPGGFSSRGVNQRFVNYQNRAFFFASTPSGSLGQKLWATDGTAAGTVQIAAIPPAYPGDSIFFQYLTVSNGSLYFTQVSGGQPQPGLWKSDGTSSGTAQVEGFGYGQDDPPKNLTNVDGTLFFLAYNPAMNSELWKSDGTPAGTVPIPISFNASGVTLHPPEDYLPFATLGKSIFVIGYTTELGYELWRTDGTAAGTRLVKDINLGPGGGGAVNSRLDW